MIGFPSSSRAGNLSAFACAVAIAFGASYAQDTGSPVFANDSAKTEAIRAVEAGAKPKADSLAARAAAASRKDSLQSKLSRRGVQVGISAGAAFGEHSAGDRFSSYMSAQAAAAGQRILRSQDPVHVFFPVGFFAGYPLFENFDAVLRTEHFYYKVTGLAQKDNDSPTEFWYSNQAHLAGAGLRWQVPLSLFTVDGRAGLFAAYTHFWNFGPTGIKSSSGSLLARTEPAGAGYEIQLGFQQDFAKRWTYTGGLSVSRLSFDSDGDWSNVIPTTSGPASWTLNSVRFALQGMYQFGRK